MGVKERYEERQKKGEKSSYSGVYERSVANEIDDVASSISSRASTWLQNHNNYLSNFNDRYSGRTGTYEDSYVSDAGDWLSTITQQKENFDKEASDILSVLDQYGDYLDKDWADSIRNTLTGAAQQQADILKHATNDSDFWSQFDSEDTYAQFQEYNRAQQRLADYQKKYEGKSYDELQIAIGQMEDGEEKDWLSSHQYDVLGTVEDFGDKSASGWEKYLAEQEAKQQAEDDKPWYQWLAETLGQTSDTTLPGATIAQVQDTYRKDTTYQEPSDKWTDQQKATYGYLYETDSSAAAQYAQTVNEANNQAENQEKITAIEQWATKNGWTGTAATLGAIAMMPLSLADTLNALTEYTARGTVSTSATPLPGQVSEAITGAIATTLNGKYGTLNESIPVIGGKGVGDAYQLANSIANSMISGYTQGTLGTYVVFFGSAASSGMYDAKKRGATDEQAITFGVLNGLAEAAGEALSVENLLKLGGVEELSSFFGNVLMQAGIEASEEGMTTLLNNFSEQLVLQDKSTFNILVKQYMAEEGLTEEEAKKKAWKSMANDLVFDMLGGAISGGVSSGLQTGVQTMFVNHAENKNAQQIYGDDPGALVGEALEIDPGNAYAQKMQGRLDSGKSLSGGQLNNLVQQNEAAMTAQDMASIQDAAAQRLTELGETGDVDTVAAALAKQAAGEKLSRAEKQAISRSQYGTRVANELNTDNIRSGGYSSQWAESIGTERINAEDYSRMVGASEQAQEGAEVTGGKVVAREQNGAQAGQTGTESGAKGQEIATASVRTGLAMTEEASRVSEDGVTRQASTGRAVTPQKIVSIDGGKAMIQTDGGAIAADDIQFGDTDTDLLWRSAMDFDGINTAGANGIIRAYRSGDSVTTYLNGAAQEFQNGYYNMGSGGKYADQLTPAQRAIIYELGQKAAGENTAKEQAKASAARKAARKGADANEGKRIATSPSAPRNDSKVGQVHFERSGRTFDAVQETALKTMDHLSKALGVDFYVYESYVNEAGQRVYMENGREVHAPNGKYVNGKIYIDLNAGVDGKGTMLFTIAHELTHFIREWSPAKFKVLANALVKQYAGQNVSVDALVDNQIKKAKKNGREISRDEAFEEVVADSMESMLKDGNVMQQVMAEVKQQDRGLWQKICDWFKDLVADLKAVVEAYKGLKPDSPEGKAVADMQDVIELLEGLYAEALTDAGENYRAVAGTQKNTTREGGAKYSQRYLAADTNSEILDMVNRVANGEFKANEKVYLGTVTDAIADQIHHLTGIQVNGFKVAIEARQIDHILKDHGKNGVTDHSMADPNDIARMEYVLGAPDDIRNAGKTQAYLYMREGKNRHADTVLYEKNVGAKSYYVVQAVPDTKAKTLYIVSAFIGKEGYKKEASQLINAKSLDATAKTEVASTSKDNVAQNANEVKEKFSDRDSTYAEIAEEQQKLHQREVQLRERKRIAANDPALLQAMDEVGDMFTEIRGLLPKRRNGTATQAELDRIEELKALRDERIQQVAKLQESLGLNAIAQEETEIREKKEALRIASDAAWAREGAEKENKAIDKAGVSAAEYFRKKALRAFKTTTNFNEAGYLLPDGKLLNFSGGERNHRYRDHREIGEIYEATQGVAALNRFLNDGNIRIMAESPGADLASGVEPTKEQYDALRRFINTNGVKDGQFFVDFSDADGRRAGNYSYQGRVNADRVINDIKHYYATGEIREQSSVAQFRYSDRDSDGNQLSEEQQEYFKDSKIRDASGNLKVMHHGSGESFTVFDRKKAKSSGYYGKGFYFTDSTSHAQQYGNTYDVYLNITNPLQDGTKAITKGQFRKFVEAIAENEDYGIENYGYDATVDSVVRSVYGKSDFAMIMDINASSVGNMVEAIELFNEVNGTDYNGIVAATETVAFYPEQIKNVDNKAPTSDPDIRFSERDQELEKVNRVLVKENTELKYDIAYLKELLKLQKQVTGGTKFTKTSVEAAAGQLMKYANAKGEKAELAGLLTNVYEYIAKGEELTWEGVKEAAQPAVDWLQRHVRTEKQVNSYAQDVLRQVRGSRIYLDEQQKKEAAYLYGSYNAFRQKMMGSVIITDKGATSLDSQWQEWASLYPDIFDGEVTTNDMPAALMDAIDSLRNMNEVDSYGYDAELFGQELLRQVYDSYWNVSTLYTATDKAQKEINKLKYEHSTRMAALRKFHSEKTAQLKREHMADLQRVRQEYRERSEKKQREIMERYQESRKKGAENRKKTEMRRKIRRTIMDLDKLLNRGNKKLNVKDDMQDLVAKTLKSADILFTEEYSNEDMIRDGVGTELTEQEARYMAEAREILEQMGGDAREDNLQGKLDYRIGKLKDVFVRERARLNKTKVSDVLGNLAEAYASLEKSEYNYVSGAFDENVHQYLTMLKSEVGGTTIQDMSLGQMEDLHRAYTMVLTTVRNANKLFAVNMKQTREQLGSQTIAEVRKAGGEHGLWLPGTDKVNAFSWNNQKPVYAFERIGSDTLTKLFENTRAGEDGWAQDMTEAREYYLEQTRKHKADGWDYGKRYQFTSTSGIDFSLDLEQIMSLYAYSKREQAHDHLMKGGFVFDSNTEVQVSKMGIKVNYLNRNAKAHNVSMEILADIVSKLTAEQKAFVDEMQDYLSTTMGGKGNEVSMQMYGVKLFNEKNYFPLRSAGQYMERAKEADLKKEQGQISIVNSGFTKATTPKSSNPVVLSGFMDVWADHVNEMSMYHSFVLPMEDFRRVYNYSSPNMETGQSISVNSVIQDAYGKEATDYIDQLYRDLNGGAVSDPRETPAKALMGKFKKAAVFASMSVVIQQPSAIGRAFAIIDPKYFIGGKMDAKRHKALWAELKQYAPVATIKEMGYFDTGMGKSAQDFIKGKEYGTIKEKAAALFTDENYRDELLSKGPALADELTWCAMWEAVKRETKAKNPGMKVTSEEFLTAAGERFTEVITKTQVYDSVLSRSANMRSKGAFMSMWTAFMAEPTTTINMVEDAIRKGKAGDKKYAARAMGAVLSSVVINSLLVSLVYAMRDDDDDETFLEKYVQSFATEILDGINPLTYYPLLKDIWSVMQGFDIERSDMSLITDLTEALTKLVQVYSKDTDGMDEEQQEAHSKSLSKAWWGVVDYVTALAGIPVKNVRRDINGAMNMIKTISADLTDRDTSWGSLLDKTWDDVKNTIPVVGWLPDETAADKLYKATVSGDTAYQERLEGAYTSQTSLDNVIRKGLRANDSRIWEAAIAWNDNDLETYKRIAKEIIGEGNFSQDNVVMAIQAEAKAMADTESSGTSESKAKGYFTAEKFGVAISQGNDAMAATIKADIIETAQKNGKTAEEAEASFASSAKSNLKELFMDGSITKTQAANALADYCGISEDDAQTDVQFWAFQKEYPEYDLSESAVAKYYESIQPSGISVDVYYDYYTQARECEGDKDADGNTISGSKKAKILAVIHSLDISSAQKDVLYYANGWAESTLSEAPWH